MGLLRRNNQEFRRNADDGMRNANPSVFNYVLFLFLFTGILFFRAGILQAVSSTATQSNWAGGTSANTTTTFTGWTKYSNADTGIVAGTDIKLKSIGYGVTDDGALSCSTGNCTTQGVSGGLFGSASATKVNTSLNPSAADSTASVKLLGTWVFVCGDTIQDIDGNTYNTVLIGTQCWMKTNLRTTKYRNGIAITRGSSTATWPGTDQGYYAYPPNATNSAEETLSNIISNNLGFVYQWSAVVNANGICPTGWHVPTDAEFKVLVEGQATAGCEILTGWQCSPAGTNLKSGGTSGFEGLLAGYRYTSGSFNSRGSSAYFWSSSVSGSYAWYRSLTSGLATVYRSNDTQAFGFSVRCLKD